MTAIIDYGMGNLGSVKKAFEYFGDEAVITSDKAKIETAKAIVLPGVGAFPKAMENLDKLSLITVIQNEVKKGKPFLGICLGFQLLFDKGEEGRICEGLSLVEGEVKKFAVSLKIPHIGWNEVKVKKETPFSETIKDGEYFYFVHSYYASVRNKEDILFTTEYEIEFTSAVAKDNVYGTQFHPEKSQDKGLLLIENFIKKVCK